VSTKVSEIAIQLLRQEMFNNLPKDVQAIFPKIADPLSAGGGDNVPNIVPGHVEEYGTLSSTPMVTVYSSGPAEGILKVWRHLDLYVDVWMGASQVANMDARRIVAIIAEYIYRSLHNRNWSAEFIQIKRSYEVSRSEILFEPTNKIYHISSTYRVEALSSVGWY